MKEEVKIYVNTCPSCDDFKEIIVIIGENRNIITGDCYHDKINEKLKGTLEMLDILNIDYKIIEGEYLNCIC